MSKILADFIGKCVFVYIEYILVYNKTDQDHVKHLQLVFDKVRDAGFKLKPTKCAFGLPEVKLLCYVLNADGIITDPDKVDVIAKLKRPTTVKQVISMLGMCNYSSLYSSNFFVSAYGSTIKLTSPLSFVLNCCVKNNTF